MSLAFLTSVAMAKVNRTTRGKASATTVLSFAYPPSSPQDCVGDVLLCLPAIHPFAQVERVSLDVAVCQLFLHGLAHLAGYDHATSRTARRMERLERHLLAS